MSTAMYTCSCSCLGKPSANVVDVDILEDHRSADQHKAINKEFILLSGVSTGQVKNMKDEPPQLQRRT
jgi:hypothetical protein